MSKLLLRNIFKLVLCFASLAYFTLVQAQTTNIEAFDDELFFPMDNTNSHLYFENLSLISQFDTVTILLNGVEPKDNRLLDIFYKFARTIGLSNGATVINSSDFDKLSFTLNNLNCAIPASYPSLIFVARHSKYCDVFNIEAHDKLIASLLIIQRALDCSKNDNPKSFNEDISAELKSKLNDNTDLFAGLMRLAEHLSNQYYVQQSLDGKKLEHVDYLIKSMKSSVQSNMMSKSCFYTSNHE